MHGIRRTLSAGALASFAALGLLVVMSAPAAAGPGSMARPFLTGALARGQPIQTLERAQQLSIPRVSAPVQY